MPWVIERKDPEQTERLEETLDRASEKTDRLAVAWLTMTPEEYEENGGGVIIPPADEIETASGNIDNPL